MHISNEHVSVPIERMPTECIISDYRWIFSFENAESLNNRKNKNATLLVKAKDRLRPLSKKDKRINICFNAFYMYTHLYVLIFKYNCSTLFICHY